ncbi:MAG TPA: hypothetical protein VG713_06145 [Pirellulales bacterium]|nr:hypothetical protein [Pirellulales bacterium]
MRMLMNVRMPHAPFNALVREGTAGQKIMRILDTLKPEAAYFTEHEGERTAMLIVDLADPSKIPSLAEPWYLTFQADVDFRVVMTLEDLKRSGLDEIAKNWT